MSDFVKSICDYGGEVYVVGGAIRNYLYNKYHNAKIKIKDYDFLVRLVKQDELIIILEKSGTIKEVGQSFGIILYTPFESKNIIEIALPRTETSTGARYKDFEIVSNETISLKEDFSRRDATINAMAFQIYSLEDLKLFDSSIDSIGSINLTESLIDPFGGFEDIKNKKWKCVGDPEKRFIEDPTRIMRAFRQSSELNLTLESNTMNSIKNNYKIMCNLIPQSYVRLYNEFFRMLDTNDYIVNLKIMYEIGILKILGIDNVNLNKLNDYAKSNTLLNNFLENSDIINNQLLFKFANLLKVQEMKSNIKLWCNEKQIGATNYFTKKTLNILVSIQLHYNSIILVESKYQLLKIIEKIYKMFLSEYYDIVKHIICYALLNGDLTIENTLKLIKFTIDVKDYPPSTDQLIIDGNKMMKLWNIEGKQIKIIKDKLLDNIFNDKCINSYDSLFDKITEIVSNQN